MAKSNTTQDFVPIREIRNGVLILKDGSLRSVLMVSSMNFGLKSDDEKKAILFEYQNFLNALDFPTQISVQSRKLDIRPYLATLKQRMVAQTNELLKIQIKEYMEFIKVFTEQNNVMTKSFYVVASYTPPILSGGGGILAQVSNVFRRNKNEVGLSEGDFNENVEQLNQRINVIKGGMSRVGLRADILGTEEMIELYFKMFNPGESEVPGLPEK